MPETAKNIPTPPTQATILSNKKPWLRQEGESALWFNRFQRYLDLGPKRSLLAAVQQEKSQIKAVKSTDKKPTQKQKKGVAAHLSEVPATKIQVPGSWKQASKHWQWVARAKAWDAHVIEHTVEENLQRFLRNAHTTPMSRITALENLLTSLQNNYNANRDAMTVDQDIKYSNAMQAVLRDIRIEMSIYDEAVARAVIRLEATRLYESMTPAQIAAAPTHAK
jgi:hypothetical protein